MLLSFLVFGFAGTALCADVESSYQQARTAYHDLQGSARKQLYRENWQRVIDRFAGLHKQYPNHRRGVDALYLECKARVGLYQVSRVSADALAAVGVCQQLADEYPRSALADDALVFAAGLQQDALGDPRSAYLNYARVVEKLPKGDMAGKARQRMQELAAHAPLVTEVKPVPQISDGQPAAATAGGETRLTAIRFWSNPGYTRVVLDISQASQFTANFLAADAVEQAPPRLYVDVSPASLDDTLMDPTVVDDGLLRRIRTGKPKEKTVRVVLDLGSVADYKVFALEDPYRIVIDIAGEKVAELKRNEPEITALPPGRDDAIAKVLGEVPKPKPSLHIPEAPSAPGLRRIVVDAGHGGKDPGAVGPNGTLEKDVTLALAKRLAAKLGSTLGCEVILTRSGDVYLPLEERTAIANKVGADLFISMHANANTNRSAYGVETYYLNFSKNDKAAAVAARENGTSLKQVSDLELILFDLMANAKINESSRLAAEIQKGLVDDLGRKYADVRDLGVRQGPFYVLLGATMPSVLVEAAFISNPREEKRLTSTAYQDHVAEAIVAAVKDYAVAHKLIASR